MSSVSRRVFLTRAMAAAAGSIALPGIAKAFQEPEVFPAFDFHAHPGMFFMKTPEAITTDASIATSVAGMKSGRLAGGFFSLVGDLKLIKVGAQGVEPVRSYQPGEAWPSYQQQLASLKKIIERFQLVNATKASDYTDAINRSTTAVYLAVEGGDFLEGDAGKLELMHHDGVRSVQLVHYYPNELGDLQTSAPKHNGLSAAGKAVVKKMNALKMVIDVAHASEETTKHIAAMTTAPIILSHTALKRDEPRPIAARAITREHARIIASTGGVIGMWPSGFNTSFDDFVDNTKRMIDAVGVEHVGLGTDMDANFKPVLSSYDQVPKWTSALRKAGLSKDEVTKVAGGNAARVLSQIL